MEIIPSILAILAGTGAALALYRLTNCLRLPVVANLAALLGWLVSAVVTVFSVAMIVVWIGSIGNPLPGMTPLLGMAGLYLLGLIGLAAWLGAVHARRYETTWAQAFGIAIVKLALLVVVLHLGYLVPGLLGCAPAWFFSLLVTFVALEFVTPSR